jgi:hypothetical protein
LVERAFEFHLFDAGEGLIVGFAGLFFGGFAGLPEFEQDDEILDGGVDGVVEFDPVFVELDIL